MSNLGALNVTRSTLRFNEGSSGGPIASGTTDIDLSGTTITDNVPDSCTPLNMIPGCVD